MAYKKKIPNTNTHMTRYDTIWDTTQCKQNYYDRITMKGSKTKHDEQNKYTKSTTKIVHKTQNRRKTEQRQDKNKRRARQKRRHETRVETMRKT